MASGGGTAPISVLLKAIRCPAWFTVTRHCPGFSSGGGVKGVKTALGRSASARRVRMLSSLRPRTDSKQGATVPF